MKTAFNADVMRDRPQQRCTNGPSLFDAPPPLHRHSTDTERYAARKIAPIAGTLRALVLEWIIDAGAGGLTGKEAGAKYALSLGRDENDGSARYSAMPRITELRQAGLIRDSGQRRDGAIVWVARDTGPSKTRQEH
jgi:hypothetical protein